MQTRKISLIGLLTGLLLLCSLVPVLALDDGAYTISCTPSYTNPLTGSTVDGGTNVALGDSMVSSIVESQLLVEQTNGHIYLTVGLGLASNVSNVRFMVMNSDGSMYSTGAVITGSSSANGDTVNHYRIEISSLTQYISPIMYVTPMGRDVQFFITLHGGSATPGTGIYSSQMIPAAQPETSSEENQSTQSSTAETEKKTAESKPAQSSSNSESSEKEEEKTVDTEKEAKAKTTDTEKKSSSTKKIVTAESVSKESLFKGVSGLSTHEVKAKKSDEHSIALYIGGGILVLAVLGGGYFYVKKIKK